MAERAPQLIMRRPHLLNLPAPRVPQGYEIRHFRKGDEAGWNALMDLAFERTPGRADFTRDMAADELYRPERVRLVLDDAGAIAPLGRCRSGSRRQRAGYGSVAGRPARGPGRRAIESLLAHRRLPGARTENLPATRIRAGDIPRQSSGALADDPRRVVLARVLRGSSGRACRVLRAALKPRAALIALCRRQRRLCSRMQYSPNNGVCP